jgi:hypothetical protein
VVREIAIISNGWEGVRSDPLEAGTVILNPCADDGCEDKADEVEVALYNGKVGERGGRESHEEGGISLQWRIYSLLHICVNMN